MIPSYLEGKKVLDVVRALQYGSLTPDQIRIGYFEHNGQWVSANSRGLAALSLAGKEPVNTYRIWTPDTDLKDRIEEGDWWGGSLPSHRIVMTDNSKSLTYYPYPGIIEIPRWKIRDPNK